ncbi:hypothetical protein GSI_05855 [Ganoderma sinense ZZ0214-1]|uniref:Uncharacterized protein n=1 Tax=Ganoderma sinense ZZ0214-1 TaxID=1077348 RepID=A0A2G8SC33_9APHY|nr:hypothetical protein GSI_05855 [Ganoderma sinense ZZ0214-1]
MDLRSLAAPQIASPKRTRFAVCVRHAHDTPGVPKGIRRSNRATVPADDDPSGSNSPWVPSGSNLGPAERTRMTFRDPFNVSASALRPRAEHPLPNRCGRAPRQAASLLS